MICSAPRRNDGMADLSKLEERIERLEKLEARRADIEGIKRVKYKYFRCLDSKLWDEMKDCFTEDARTDFRSGTWAYDGRDAIIHFLSSALPHKNSVHQGHHPEIEITGESTANAVWSFNDYVLDRQTRLCLQGAGFYYDEYVKVDGEWKIQLTGYVRTFEETWDRDGVKGLELTANRFEDTEDP
jgi:hypothetical protein